MYGWPFRAAKEPVQPLAVLDSFFALRQKYSELTPFFRHYHPCITPINSQTFTSFLSFSKYHYKHSMHFFPDDNYSVEEFAKGINENAI